jgi:TPR repeat protein
VEASNRNAQILLQAQAAFQPEYASFFGVPGYDDKVADFGPDNPRRYREALAKAKAGLLNGSYRWGNPTATSLRQLSWSEAFHVPLASIPGEDCDDGMLCSLRYTSVPS